MIPDCTAEQARKVECCMFTKKVEGLSLVLCQDASQLQYRSTDLCLLRLGVAFGKKNRLP